MHWKLLKRKKKIDTTDEASNIGQINGKTRTLLRLVDDIIIQVTLCKDGGMNMYWKLLKRKRHDRRGK